MRLLAESISSVKDSIRDYLCITEPQDWDTLALVKQILNYYAVTHAQDDVRAFATCYETVLQDLVANTSSIPEKAEEAGRRLKAVKKVMDTEAVKQVFLEKHLEQVKRNVVLTAQSSLLSEAAAELANANDEAEPKKKVVRGNEYYGESTIPGPQVRQRWSIEAHKASSCSTICRQFEGRQKAFRYELDPRRHHGRASSACLFRQLRTCFPAATYQATLQICAW